VYIEKFGDLTIYLHIFIIFKTGASAGLNRGLCKGAIKIAFNPNVGYIIGSQ